MKDRKMAEVIVLRWGHRLRDERLTTHIVLTARALGASGVILSDVEDKDVKHMIEKVVERWGGPFFFEMSIPWMRAINKWRKKGGIVVHLTAYGENIETSDVLKRIKSTGKDVMVLIGSQKVPPDFFREEVSEFNVAIGNEPHSECSALAIFLDRYFEGREISKEFKGAKVKIIPQKRGKRVVFISDRPS
ncbi:MAG: tRNA (cytidine(56)-2'-O)-methyltransferase [Candidatus Methylarchaceae archaeon HK01M]|nr:tRNA (cytidine(56)-2'-O)-methyltransferase [Candidatus Methylarchaceae archaeon HK01M]